MYGLNRADSGALAVTLLVRVEDIWTTPAGEDGKPIEGEPEQWCDWSAYGFEVRGDIWIVKTDGTLLEKNIRRLIDNAGWDGSISSIANDSWKPKKVMVEVEEDVWKNKTRYRIAWVNSHDSVPGTQIGNVSEEVAAELEGMFGAQMRALAGSATTNAAPPPAEKPTRRRRKKKKDDEAPKDEPKDETAPVEEPVATPTAEEIQAGLDAADDEIPF